MSGNNSRRKRNTPADIRGCVSAGNTPPTSPIITRKVMSQSLHRRSFTNVTRRDSDFVNVEDDSFSTEESISAESTGPADNSLAKAPSAKCQKDGKKGCPCFGVGSKCSFQVKCSKCDQSWHPDCVNLSGITQGASKKLVNWKCPHCYVFPYHTATDVDGNTKEAFNEFLKVTSDIRKFNEELKDSASSIDFFNVHVKHLMLNEDTFIQQSNRIGKLEESVTDIKSMLSNLVSKLSMDGGDKVLEEIASIRVQMGESNQCNNMVAIQKELENIKNALTLIKETQSAGTPDEGLASIKETLITVEKHGSEIEKNSISMKEELDWLKGILDPEEEGTILSKDRGMLEHIDGILTNMNSQLESINEHICPQTQSSGLQVQMSSHLESEVDDMGPPMTPNTVSPHYVPHAEPYTSPPCEPFEKYVEDIVPNELKSRLIGFLAGSSSEFQSVGSSRDVLYFGEFGYHYTGAYHAARQTPLIIQELLSAVRPSLPFPNSLINSCLITRYTDGSNHIPMHSDNENSIDPESVIVTVSLGEEREIKFVNAHGVEKSLKLKDGSAYVMSRFSQDFWKHGIDPLEPSTALPDTETETSVTEPVTETNGPTGAQCKTRYSFTFRHTAPHFKNSLAVVGDSNTQNIKFGRNIGTLGVWAPGKRVKASKIENIPPPHEIGPYRNIIIHTGINNISDENNRRSNKSLIANLAKKCDDIHACYPKTKVHVSLLLPTKSSYVNSKVTELNNLILDMTYSKVNTYVLDNSNLGTERGLLPEKYGRYLYNGRPNSNDIVHLGKEGLKVFCRNIKKCVSHRGNSQSMERFRGSRGNYGGAVVGGDGRDIMSR